MNQSSHRRPFFSARQPLVVSVISHASTRSAAPQVFAAVLGFLASVVPGSAHF